MRNEGITATFFAGVDGWANGAGGWGQFECHLKASEAMIITHNQEGVFDLELLTVTLTLPNMHDANTARLVTGRLQIR